MGLDVYVGSLTRYHSGTWETTAQRIARENNMSFRTVRPEGASEPAGDPETIRPIVLQWRNNMNAALGTNLSAPLDWDETPDGPYFTDKPTWDCYASLLLWAAYSEHPDLKRPEACIEVWADDEAFNRSTAEGFKTSYPALLRENEVWLPAPFAFSFTGANVAGKSMGFASAYSLRDELAALNARTWNANETTISQWRRDGAEHLSPMGIGARFAFAIFHQLANAAVDNRLVMLLDY